MKLIGLEEHIVTDDVIAAWARLAPAHQDDVARMVGASDLKEKLKDVGGARLAAMDATGLDVHVLSLMPPGVQGLDSQESVALAERTNDLIAAIVAGRPGRYQGFATLPTPAPEAAARELRRCITALGFKGAMLCGRTRDRNLDHPDFRPIFAAAADLRVPLYIHPQTPQRAVREAYYTGFGEALDLAFATSGIGWHYETGIQFLRLILAGTFDRHPDLQIILGHWGEVVLFYLDRIDDLSRRTHMLKRPVADYVRSNLVVTPSGMFSQSYLQRSIEILGVDRILFSTDYPFRLAPNGGARAFLDGTALGDADKAKIAHGNWERLTAGGRRAGA